MLIIPQPKRQRRKFVQFGAPPAPAALNLIAASFDPDGPITYLTFDREIDISAIVVGAFAVADGPDNGQFVGVGASFNSPTQVAVTMNRTGGYSGDSQLLTVGSTNGIVAVDDGGTWAGATDLVLPWP